MSDAVNSTTEPVDDDPVATRLRELGASDEVIAKLKDELGVTSVGDLAEVTVEDLTEAGMKVIPARKAVAALRPVATGAADANAVSAQIDSILPAVPDEGAWLEALRSGGVLKVDTTTVIAAIRSAIAYKVGLYEVPKRLVAAMEQFAEESEDPVDETFFALRAEVTRRDYADIFAGIPGLDGNFVTEKRKQELFRRIDTHLWPAIADFYAQLRTWQEAWLQGANPAMMVGMFASLGSGVGLPPGIMQPPDTGVLRDQAAAVADAVNRIFAGTGAQIASALASEALQIRKTLENPRLPSLVGAPNRDQMLRQLGVSVTPAYPRLEQTLAKFVVAVLEAQRQTADTEVQYYGALFMLASQMPWSEVGVSDGKSGIGRITPIGGAPARELGRAAISGAESRYR